MMQSKGQYINGQWVKSNGSALESINPSYGTVFWQGTSATEDEISGAADAAHQALPAWAAFDFEQRAQYTKNLLNK